MIHNKNNENQKNFGIPHENYENHEILKFYEIIMQLIKIKEFHMRINTIIEFHIRISEIKKILESHVRT